MEDLEDETHSSREVGLDLLQTAEMKFYGTIAGLQVNMVSVREVFLMR